jgi:hypothetical protein
MPPSDYDSYALMLLSEIFIDVLRIVTNSASRPLTQTEEDFFGRIIADNLMKVFELGVRDRAALILAGLEGLPFSTDSDGREVDSRAG